MHEDLSPYRVAHAAEVAALLARLRDDGPPVVLAAGNGVSLGAHLGGIDARAGSLHFDVGGTSPQLESLIAADEVTAISQLDDVRLQFTLQGLVLVHDGGHSTLQSDWPDHLLRLQRRDSYRVRLGARAAPSVSLRHPSLPDMQLRLRLLDVSAGGCAILLPDDVPDLQPGTRIHGVQVQLDLETRIEAGLLLHHVSAFDGEGGPRRIGCSWVGLQGPAERALQRFILQTQKRQRLLRGPA